MKRVIIVLLLFLCYKSNAQNKAIDSLRAAIRIAREDTNKANSTGQLGWEMVQTGNYDSALYYGSRALKLSEKIRFGNGEALAYTVLASVYFYKGDYPKSLYNYEIALKISKATGYKDYEANLYMDIGNVYGVLGKYPDAVQNYFQALKINESTGNKAQIASTYDNIGLIYSNWGNHKEALKNYFSALRLNKEAKKEANKQLEADLYANIGSSYVSQGNYPDALKNFDIALKITEETGDKVLAAGVYDNIGLVYYDQHKYGEALKNHFASLKLNEAIEVKASLIINYYNIGNAYIGLGHLEEGKEWLLRSIALSKETGSIRNIQANYLVLSLADSMQGNYAGAYENYKLYVLYLDSLYNEGNSKKMTQVAMQYEFDKKEAARKSAQEKEDIWQKNIRNSIIAGLGLTLVFLFITYYQRNKVKKEKQRSDELLRNILPEEISNELKERGATTAREFDAVTVIFTDFVDFTKIGERMSSQQLVQELHHCFKAFDEIIAKYNIEKIKTIGDAYLAVSGLPITDDRHAINILHAALEIRDFMLERKKQVGDQTFGIRIGVHSGSVVAGIVGIKKFAYDIWGDTVNTAARMEQNSEAGKINISGSTYDLVKDKFECNYRGRIQAKNKGELDMYFVLGNKLSNAFGLSNDVPEGMSL